MKKSNIILLSFIGFVFLLAFTVHAALDRQYRKGNFEIKGSLNDQQFTTITLQSFSKVYFKGQSFNDNGNRNCDLSIEYDSAGGNQLKINKVNFASMTYVVSNDTLFVNISDPKDDVRCHLSCSRLNFIATNSNTSLIQHSPLKKLDIVSGGFLSLDKLDAGELGLVLNDNANCVIEPGGKASQVSLEMRGASTFEADNSSLNFSRTKFSENSKLLLSGKALQSFTRP